MRGRPPSPPRRAAGRALVAALAVLIGIAGAPPAAAEARAVRAEAGLPPTHPVIANGWAAFIEQAAADPDTNLDISLFLNGPRVGSQAALDGIARGDTDMGFVAFGNHPAEFPYAAFVGELAMVGGDGLAAAAALTEMFTLRCRPCRADLARRQLVYLGTYSAAPYVVIGRAPLERAESWRERRFATPGSLWDRVVRHVGGTTLPLDEDAIDAFETGGVDGLIDIAATLRDARIWERARTVLKAPLGAYRGASPFTAGREFWLSLAPAERRALLKAAPYGIVAATWAYELEADQVLKEARERGLAVTEPDPLLDDQVRSFAEADMRRVAEAAHERIGIADAEMFLADLRALYDKYVTLLGPHVRTPEDAATVLWQEIFARLDPAAYGVEPTN